MTNPKNPFQQDQWLTELIGLDDGVKGQAKKTYNQFRLNQKQLSGNKSSNGFQSIFFKFFVFLTRHVIVTSLIGLILLTSVGAFAAEITAPAAYKPSRIAKELFKPISNQQIVSTNKTELDADLQNQVATLNDCDILLKYPLKSNDENVNLYQLDSSAWDPGGLQNAVITGENAQNTSLNQISFGCSSSPDRVITETTPKRILSPKELKDFTGWLIADSDLLNITDFYNPYNSSHLLRFEYRNRWYSIGFIEQTVDKNEPGLYGNQIQIQFKSLSNTKNSIDLRLQKNLVRNNPEISLLEDQTKAIFDSQAKLKNCNLSASFDSKNELNLQAKYGQDDQKQISKNILELDFGNAKYSSSDIPALKIECSSQPFNAINNAQNQKLTKPYYFDDSVFDKLKNPVLQYVANQTGLNLDNDSPQLAGQRIFDFQQDSMFYRITQNLFLENATKLNLNQNPLDLSYVNLPQFKLDFDLGNTDLPTVDLEDLANSITLKPENTTNLKTQILNKPCLPSEMISYTDSNGSSLIIQKPNSNLSSDQQQKFASLQKFIHQDNSPGSSSFINSVLQTDCNSQINILGFAPTQQYGDAARAILYTENLSSSPDISEIKFGLYARKNDTFVFLNSFLITDKTNSNVNTLLVSCNTAVSQHTDKNCLLNKLLTDPQAANYIQQIQQDLINEFKLNS